MDYGSVDETAERKMIYELHAVVLHLYGLSADHVEVIYETFHDNWDYKERLDEVLKYHME